MEHDLLFFSWYFGEKLTYNNNYTLFSKDYYWFIWVIVFPINVTQLQKLYFFLFFHFGELLLFLSFYLFFMIGFL